MRRVLASSALSDDLAGDGGRLADMPAAPMSHQIYMDVIVVVDIGAGRQHGRELLACRQLHVMQKSLLFGGTAPTVLHANPVAVGERELGDVERVLDGDLQPLIRGYLLARRNEKSG